MSQLFTVEWMNQFKDEWNKEPQLASALQKIGFNSTIGYGFDGENDPRGVLTVVNGEATEAGLFDGQDLSWDLRASTTDWEKWSKKPPGMVGLGIAYSSRKLKFEKGDYAAMVKDPRMAGPFIKSFGVMGRVK